ncbi:hypothetical protein D030_0642B, partial [Vibrio parahaemolyticus AQ3810]
DPLVELSCRH